MCLWLVACGDDLDYRKRPKLSVGSEISSFTFFFFCCPLLQGIKTQLMSTYKAPVYVTRDLGQISAIMYLNCVHLKGIVHPKMKILSPFTQLFQTCIHFLLLWYTKKNILKNVGNQTVDNSHWLPYMLWKNILQNIYAQQKKETHSVLKQLEGE